MANAWTHLQIPSFAVVLPLVFSLTVSLRGRHLHKSPLVLLKQFLQSLCMHGEVRDVHRNKQNDVVAWLRCHFHGLLISIKSTIKYVICRLSTHYPMEQVKLALTVSRQPLNCAFTLPHPLVLLEHDLEALATEAAFALHVQGTVQSMAASSKQEVSRKMQEGLNELPFDRYGLNFGF